MCFLESAGAIFTPSVITPAVGFTGVILTLWWNARLSRKGREDDRAHDRRVLANALVAEFTILKEAYQRQVDTLSKPRAADDSFLIPTADLAIVFPTLIGDLGVLPSAAVQIVVDTHLSLRTYYQTLILILGKKGKGSGDEFVEVGPVHVAHVKEAAESLIPKIEAALTALDALM